MHCLKNVYLPQNVDADIASTTSKKWPRRTLRHWSHIATLLQIINLAFF
jgi:hypothetical protein